MQLRKDTLVRQKEIVSAARKLIVKYGSENVTIKKVAQEIGVTEGAIYRHFKSKRDILSFLIDDIEETLLGDIDKYSSGDIGSLEALEKIMIDHMSLIEQRRGVTFQVIAEIISFGDKKLNDRAYDVINKYIIRIKAILSHGIENEMIKDDIDIDAISKLFFGMNQGLVNMWALSNYSFNMEKEYKPILKIFLKSIKSHNSRE
jgi:AcrR family transcriptional regulator